MPILLHHSDADNYAAQIVRAALMRSFTSLQVPCGPRSSCSAPAAHVWINPPEEAAIEIRRVLDDGGKAIVLGRIGRCVAEVLQLEYRGELSPNATWADCGVDHARHHDESPAAIEYDQRHPLAQHSPLARRPLCRYDFANEWNNHGFGRITQDGTPWSLACDVGPGGTTILAEVTTPADQPIVYAALTETSGGAILWFNRPVGPIDSLEWRIVEVFLGDYRAGELDCFPYVAEIPADCTGVVCPRLDCDESVSAARPLWEMYHSRGLPLSLAILTGQSMDAAALDFLREVVAEGGCVVSHSVTHRPNWGGSYEQARGEALDSRAWLAKHLPTAPPVRHAVSPFHQNPPYAVQALVDAGYTGFVGGIIANDPEFLLGRAGRVPFARPHIVSLSTQCMLHGDCYQRYGRSIAPYLESHDQHRAAGAMFGYLDHPFSARYQYGWSDERTRLQAHEQLIDHLSSDGGLWWASISEVLDFLARRDAALVGVGGAGTLFIDDPAMKADCRPLSIHWKGRAIEYRLAAVA